MKNPTLWTIIGVLTLVIGGNYLAWTNRVEPVFGAFGDPFLSIQLATTSLTNGYVLQTDGIDSTWVATSSLGIGSTVYLATTSPWTTGDLAQVNSDGAVNSIATSSLGLLTTDVAEGTNLYYTAARVIAELLNGNDAILGNSTTTSATSTNLYVSGQSVFTATSTWASGIHNIMHGIQALDSSGLHLHSNNGTEIAYFGAGGGAGITFPNYTSALLQTGAGGALAEYSGTSCTNQFTTALSALGVATCASVSSSTLSIANWTNGYVLQASTTAAGGFDWVSTTTLGIAGGGGTPGGSDTQIQYNNGGAFGGLSTFTTDGTQLTMTATSTFATTTIASLIGPTVAPAQTDLVFYSDAASGLLQKATISNIVAATGDDTIPLGKIAYQTGPIVIGRTTASAGTLSALSALPDDFVASSSLDIPNWTDTYTLVASTTASGGMDWLSPTAWVALYESAIESALDTLTGLTNVIISTALEIPNGNPTLDAGGEIGVETSKHTFNFHDGNNERALAPLWSKTINIETATTTDGTLRFGFDVPFNVTVASSTAVLNCSGACAVGANFNIRHDTNQQATGNALYTSDQNVTSTTTVSTFDSGFNDATIPANSIVWAEITAASTTQITNFKVTLHGYIDP